MRLTNHQSLRVVWWLAACLALTGMGGRASAQGVATTTVQGTVYLANGQPGSGSLLVSWPAFTTASNQAVTAGRLNATIGGDGYVSVKLAPNVGSTPAGLYYTAVFHLSDGTTSTEYWVVPAAAQASVSQVRAQVMPAAQAVQAVSKGYVDQSIQELTQSLLTASGGSLSGPLFLNSDPTQPLQAANKHYVDTEFGMAVPLSGGSLTGPLNLSGDPASSSQAANKHYVDTEFGMAVPLSGGSLTGPLNLSGDPATAPQAANKHYVDAEFGMAVPLSGGSLTGPLNLSGDPATASQAANKHYVDEEFAQALPLTGGTATGPLTAVQLGAAYQVDQFQGADFGAKLQACLNHLNATYGGTCDARNFTGSVAMGSPVVMSTANATVQLPCATISTANQIVVTAGTRNVTVHGCALRGASNASGSAGGTVFLYAGTGPAIQVGDATYAANTLGFKIDNVVINTTAANSATAQGLAAYRTQEMNLGGMYFLGNSNQTGMTLDGTGNYTGGTFQDLQFDGFATAVNAVGHQAANAATTDWLNASTFLRLHINCPMSGGSQIAGTYGINLQQADGNTFTGGDVEGCSTALHLGPNAQNNTIVGLRNENSTNQVVADAGSSYNNWITGGTMFTGQLTDNGTRNSFLDTFHRSFNGLNGDWYGSQKDATVTNHYRIGTGAGNERGLLNRYQTDYGYRWTTGLSDAAGGEQFYQVLDELNNVYRLSIGQYNYGQSSTNNQTVVNAAGAGAVVLNGSASAGTGGVIFGAGGATGATVATINNAGNAQFNGSLQVGGPATFTSSTTIKNMVDAEIDSFLWAGATANQKESYIYKDYTGASQWYMVKDASNNWALNSALGGLDSFKAYQSNNSGDTYINASNATGHIRLNYEQGSGTETDIYSGAGSGLVAAFLGTNAIKFPGLSASSGHNCLQIDNSGYISNTGTACGTGNASLTGTVNNASAGQIAYYAGNGNIIAGTTAVAVTAGGTGAMTAANALANLGAHPAMAGIISDGAMGVTVTGNVEAQTIEASANQVVNVMSKPYSAKGDCVTDDHDAIQQAITAACSVNPPRAVEFPKPPGGCYLSSTLAWKGVSLIGQPSGSGGPNPSMISQIRGLPGQDLFNIPDPDDVGTTLCNKNPTIANLDLVLDDSVDVSRNHPHRKPGRTVIDVVTTAGSPILTSASAEFNPGDVGQGILLTYPDSTTQSLTVVSVQSLTQATVTSNATETQSGVGGYVSIADAPVTDTIGNAIIAFDGRDGNQTNWLSASPVAALQQAVFRDVNFRSLSSVPQNHSAGVFLQGIVGSMNLVNWDNVNIERLVYDFAYVPPDTNPISGGIGGDQNKWHSMYFNGVYPFIFYNGGENYAEKIQVFSPHGFQIVQCKGTSESAPGQWTISLPEVEGNSGTGFRLEGTNHFVYNTVGSGTTYWDATSSKCDHCVFGGTLNSTGNMNTITLADGVDPSRLIINDNGANEIQGKRLTNPNLGMQSTRPALMTAGRHQPAQDRTADFLMRNPSNPFLNALDLMWWPQDLGWYAATPAPAVVADPDSISGYYVDMEAPGGTTERGIVFLQAGAFQNGAPLIGNDKNIPPVAGQFRLEAQCPSSPAFTMRVTLTPIAGGANVNLNSPSLPCSTTWSAKSWTLDLSPYSGYTLSFSVLTGGVKARWFGFRSNQEDYNGYTPENAANKGAANGYAGLNGSAQLTNDTMGNAASATRLSTTGSNGQVWGVTSGVQGWIAGGGSLPNTLGCVEGFDHLPCVVAKVKLSGQTAAIAPTSYYTNGTGADISVRVTTSFKITGGGTGTSVVATAGVSGSGTLCTSGAVGPGSTGTNATSGCTVPYVLANGASSYYGVNFNSITVAPTYEVFATVERLQ